MTSPRVNHHQKKMLGPRGPEHPQRVAEGFHEAHCSAEIRPQLTEPDVALWRSQHGPLASVPFVAFPTDRATRIDPQPFQMVLCRRRHFPLPFSSRRCRCGRQLNLTPMAIIVQRAEKPECWEDEDFQRRKLLQKCAGKAEAECQPTSWSEKWTFHQLEMVRNRCRRAQFVQRVSVGRRHNSCESAVTGRNRQTGRTRPGSTGDVFWWSSLLVGGRWSAETCQHWPMQGSVSA